MARLHRTTARRTSHPVHFSTAPIVTSVSSYVIVLDDHPLVGQGLMHYLTARWPNMTASIATDWVEVHEIMSARGAPLALVADVWLADGNSLSMLKSWRERCPCIPWLAISGDDDPAVVRRVHEAGAQGFVHKQASPEIFAAALETLLAGQTWFKASHADKPALNRDWAISPEELGLTPRQGEILQLLLRGLPNKRIAAQLHIAESTVKEHVTAILERLGVRTRVEAITLLRGRRVALL